MSLCTCPLEHTLKARHTAVLTHAPLQTLRRTAALSEDMGYECGLQYAAQHIVDMAIAHAAWCKRHNVSQQPSDKQAEAGSTADAAAGKKKQADVDVLMLCRKFLQHLGEWAAELGFGKSGALSPGRVAQSAPSVGREAGSTQGDAPVVQLVLDQPGALKRRRLASFGEWIGEQQREQQWEQQHQPHQQHPHQPQQQFWQGSGSVSPQQQQEPFCDSYDDEALRPEQTKAVAGLVQCALAPVLPACLEPAPAGESAGQCLVACV